MPASPRATKCPRKRCWVSLGWCKALLRCSASCWRLDGYAVSRTHKFVLAEVHFVAPKRLASWQPFISGPRSAGLFLCGPSVVPHTELRDNHTHHRDLKSV